MTTFIPELMSAGHAPGFAIWVARLARANDESTVLYLPDAVIHSDLMRPNLELAEKAGVEIRSTGTPGEGYNARAGLRASDWCRDDLASKPGDRLIIPTVDLMLEAERLPEVPRGVDLGVIYHQPRTQLPLIPPWPLLRRGRTGLRTRLEGRRNGRLLIEKAPHRTFVVDPHEFLGPGRRRFMRRFESLAPRLLPISSLNLEGFRANLEARRTLGLPTEGPMLVLVGHVAPFDGKCRNVLEDAWSRVRRSSPEAMLAICGGELEGDDSPRVVDEGNGVFRLARPLSQPDYLGMVREASAVWAVRERLQGVSSSIDAAMHYGKPVIVSATNVSPAWYTDGVGGIAVDHGDPRSVARGIIRALESNAPSTDAGSCLGGFEGAVEALAGRCRFTPADLPAHLRDREDLR